MSDEVGIDNIVHDLALRCTLVSTSVHPSLTVGHRGHLVQSFAGFGLDELDVFLVDEVHGRDDESGNDGDNGHDSDDHNDSSV